MLVRRTCESGRNTRKKSRGLAKIEVLAAAFAILAIAVGSATATYNPPSGYLARTSVPLKLNFPQSDDFAFFNNTPSGACHGMVCTGYVSNDFTVPNPSTGWNTTTTGSNYFFGISSNALPVVGGSIDYGFFTSTFTASSMEGATGWTNLGANWNITGKSSGGIACWGTSTTASASITIEVGMSVYDFTTSSYVVPAPPNAPYSVFTQTKSACGTSWSLPVSFSFGTANYWQTNILSSYGSSDSDSVYAWTYTSVSLSTTGDTAAFACVNYGTSAFSTTMGTLVANCAAASSSTNLGQQTSQINVSPR